MQRNLAVVLVPALLALLAGCGDDGGSSSATASIAQELRVSGFGDYLGAQSPADSTESNGWTHLHYDPAEEKAICLNGTPFQLSYRQGSENQLLIFLEGGGACWDFVTCHLVRTATATARGATSGGVLDVDNPDNPFRNWNIIYVPYCDGSVFTGDNIADYNGTRTYHHGFWNLSAAVTTALEQFPDPDRIVVSGSSAGGYGTFAGYATTRVAYPDTEIISLNDSGPGLQNHEAVQSVEARNTNWRFTERIPSTCERCDDQFTFLYEWTFERDPMSRVALYSTQEDMVIRAFLGLDGPSYRDLMVGVTNEIAANWPTRFHRYFPLGSVHTILRSTGLYTKTIEGVPFLDWLGAFLDDTDGWVDVIENE